MKIVLRSWLKRHEKCPLYVYNSYGRVCVLYMIVVVVIVISVEVALMICVYGCDVGVCI